MNILITVPKAPVIPAWLLWLQLMFHQVLKILVILLVFAAVFRMALSIGEWIGSWWSDFRTPGREPDDDDALHPVKGVPVDVEWVARQGQPGFYCCQGCYEQK